MSTFIYVIVWMIAILFTLRWSIVFLHWISYGRSEELIDKMRGIKRTFPLFWPFVIAFIAWAYIITKPF